MKIEPSGIILTAICDIQTAKCIALQPAPITAVWNHPNREQINVCRVCLEEMIRAGEWEVQGAKISRRVDVGVYDSDKKPLLIVEVKLLPNYEKDSIKWAQKVHRNILAHSGMSQSAFFLLAAYPKSFFLWGRKKNFELDSKPDYVLDASMEFQKYMGQVDQRSDDFQSKDYLKYEHAVALWLQDILKQDKPVSGWLKASGLFDAIKGGNVVEQAAI